MVVTRRAPGLLALVAIAAAVVLLLGSVPAAAYFQNANVVITTDRSAYQVGDFVNVTMRVFSFGVPTDAVSMLLRLNPLTAYSRVVNVTHDSVGVYNATFRIEAADANLSDPFAAGTIVVQVSAGLPSLTDIETDRLTVLPQADLAFVVTPSTFDTSPGATVTLTLQLTANGTPKDADALSVTALALQSSLFSGPLPVSVANVSRGTYTATLTVPASLATPSLIYVTAVANVSTTILTRFIPISVTGAQPFEIWSYTTVFLPPVAVFTIFVGDAAGGFVDGANVSLNYTYMAPPSYSTITKSAAATTDAYGRAGFSLDMGSATNVFVVTYQGNVTLGASRQAFSGYLYTPSTPGPFFQIQRTNSYAYFAPNTTASLDYLVTTTGNPIAGVHVYYYAQSDTEFIGAGNVSSDGNGTFHLSLHVPTTLVQILLVSKWGTRWYSTTDYVTPFLPLTVSTTPVRVGAVAKVTVTFPRLGMWYVGVSLGPYQPVLSASPWVEVSGFFGSWSPVQTGASATYNFSLPRYLPKDADYLLSAVALPASGLTNGSFAGEYAFSELFHIANVPAQVRGNLSTTTPAVGDVVTANASSSYDPDGYLLGYQISWGDGNMTDWVGSPLFSHAYAAPGDYRVTVYVMDDSGAVSGTQTVVHVEATILGLRQSVAIPIFGGVAAVAVAAVAYLWWRRRGRRTVSPPASGGGAPEPPPKAPGSP